MISGFVLLLGATALLAYGVRGATGAASAIVANTVFAVAILSTGDGALLLTALYWLALADWLASVVMAIVLRSSISVERIVLVFLAFSLPSSIAFTILLRSAALPALALTLGVVLILAGGYLAFRPSPRVASDRTLRWWTPPAGLAAGVIGGLFGMGGPVILLFFSRVGGSPSVFRQRMTLLSVVSSSVRLTVLALSGALTSVVFDMFIVTVPFVLIGLALGFRIHRHVSPQWFWATLGVIVSLAGCATLFRAIALA